MCSPLVRCVHSFKAICNMQIGSKQSRDIRTHGRQKSKPKHPHKVTIWLGFSGARGSNLFEYHSDACAPTPLHLHQQCPQLIIIPNKG